MIYVFRDFSDAAGTLTLDDQSFGWCGAGAGGTEPRKRPRASEMESECGVNGQRLWTF
jgi:hypothetical protein